MSRTTASGYSYPTKRRDESVNLTLLLLIVALILLGLRAFGVGARRVDLGWLGLAVFVLSFLVGDIRLDA
jgi:hypothetical protein